MLHRAFIHTVSPLTILLPSTSTPLPATRASWSSYTPVAGDAVFITMVTGSRQIVILGKAS